MKKIRIAALALIMFSACGHHDGNVYVCVSPTAHAYHADKDCRGLRACTHDIEEESEEQAKADGRTPCHFCH